MEATLTQSKPSAIQTVARKVRAYYKAKYLGREAMQRPIDKSKFDDWWMFGDHEADNQRWFEYFIR